MDVDLFFESAAQTIPLDIEVVLYLEVQPELLGRAEEARQPQGGIGRDRSLPMDDFVDPARWNADLLGEPVLTDAHGQQEFLEENLSRMEGCQLLACHLSPLVIVDDLHIVCLT